MRSGARLWALLALLPLAALATRLALESRRGAQPGAEPTPAAAPDAASAWTGAGTLADGGEVAVVLRRLHADPARQSFDARVLAERLRLDAGEPFLCRVTRRGGGAAAWDLRPAALRDAAGACAAAVPGRAPPSGDPLDALLAVPAAPAPGQAVELVLFGRAPGAQPVLALGGLSIALAPQPAALEELPVARVDAEPAAPEAR